MLDRIAERLVVAQLEKLESGQLTIVDGSRRRTFGQTTPPGPLRATVVVRDPRLYHCIILGGSIGAAEAYAHGWWSTDDLTAVVRIVARNQQLNRGLDRGLTRLLRPVHRLSHWARRNTRSGSRTNIAAHYDLGNAFFSTFLDTAMMYSCAIFPTENATLDEASITKIDRICRKLDLRPEHDVVEIGSGWGGFAVHAAQHYGCRVVTTTISREQYQYTLERVRASGLEQRVQVLQHDYRDLPSVVRRQFDKLVSIEMIEAVGERFLGDFFATCSALLKPDGAMLLQAITIADHLYAGYRRSVDFIQRHIFPGSFLPSLSAMTHSIAARTDLRLFHVDDITPHYALTLRHWRQRFRHNLDVIRRLGYSDTFLRLWEYYLSYCEGGFIERTIGDVQLLLTRPPHRQLSLRPIG